MYSSGYNNDEKILLGIQCDQRNYNHVNNLDSCDRLPYFETRAATGQNVAKVVECLLDMVMLRMEQCVDKTQRPFAQNGKRLHNGEMDEYDGSSKCAC